MDTDNRSQPGAAPAAQPAATPMETRLPPVRGLAAAHDRASRPHRPRDVRRWLRLNRLAFRAEKADLLFHGAAPEGLGDYLDLARELDFRLSLRTDASAGPPPLVPLAEAGLLDVFLTPPVDPPRAFDAWLDACHDAGLPVRVQLMPPFADESGALAGRLADAGAVAVNLALDDPFTPGARPVLKPADAAARMTALAHALADRGVEVNLMGLPFCAVGEALWPHVVNAPQFALDHAQYIPEARDLARKLYRRRPVWAAKALQSLLGQHTVTKHNWVDSFLLPWILDQPRAHAYIWLTHKVTRHLPWLRRLPRVEETPEAHAKAAEAFQRRQRAPLGEVCGRCALHRVCDTLAAGPPARLPGLAPEAVDGDPVVSAMHFARRQPKYADAVDRARLHASEGHRALARHAMDIIRNDAPDFEVMAEDYGVEGQWTHHMPNTNRWYSFTPGEKLSTPLAEVEAPFTLSVTVAGGFAEYIGFALGRHCRIMCPMETDTHRLTLHVDVDGHYVFLRDGEEVRPVAYSGTYYAPVRLQTHARPRIAIWNIDGAVVTQSPRIWLGDHARSETAKEVAYSVLVVSSRFARRLQAVLANLAHQRDFDFRRLEVVISYVPGIDATDDLIDSAAEAYPHLRIVRSPFPEQYARSKGFLINDSLDRTAGEWVLLMDSDIILAPNWFAGMEKAAPESDFIVPDGRKMLSPATTARILLGEVRPWEQWDALLAESGQYRHKEAMGVPVGFLQCARKRCFDTVKYIEYEHFEGADWTFAVHMRQAFGLETRLSGLPVLHLDHGGSQWYGTAKHR